MGCPGLWCADCTARQASAIILLLPCAAGLLHPCCPAGLLPRSLQMALCTMQVLVGGSSGSSAGFGHAGTSTEGGGQQQQEQQQVVGAGPSWDQEHVFLYKLVPGVVASSYGVRLGTANMPQARVSYPLEEAKCSLQSTSDSWGYHERHMPLRFTQAVTNVSLPQQAVLCHKVLSHLSCSACVL